MLCYESDEVLEQKVTALPLTEDDCTDGNSVAVIGLGRQRFPPMSKWLRNSFAGLHGLRS